MEIMDQKIAVKESKATCSDNRKLAEGFIKEKVVSSSLICMANLRLVIFFISTNPGALLYILYK